MTETDPAPLSDEELAEIQRRADAAAAAPWTVGDHPSSACRIDGAAGMVIYDEGGHNEADANFIAHARTDVPRLIAALRAERAEVQRLRSIMLKNADRLEQLRGEMRRFTGR